VVGRSKLRGSRVVVPYQRLLHLDFLKTFAHIVLFDKGLKRNKFKDMPQGPFYDMSTKELVALQQIFQNVFPEVYNKPEDIRSPTSVPFFDS